MMVAQPYEYTNNHWIYTKQFTLKSTKCTLNDENDSIWIIEKKSG